MTNPAQQFTDDIAKESNELDEWLSTMTPIEKARLIWNTAENASPKQDIRQQVSDVAFALMRDLELVE